MTEKEIILTTFFDCPRHELYFQENSLTTDKKNRLEEILKQRQRGLPLQYILGFSEFMGLKFKVGEGVFIPRPETEILVERTIKAGAERKAQSAKLDILDLCTGSGCIAVSLAKFLPFAEVTAVDISALALETAKENAYLNGVSDKIKFLQGDLFIPYTLYPIPYDIIIANPPYIASDEINGLPQEVRYEPRLALDGGNDGLDFYHKIIKDAPRYLKENGYLIMELGLGQLAGIKAIARGEKKIKFIEAIKDYNGIERVIILKAGNYQET